MKALPILKDSKHGNSPTGRLDALTPRQAEILNVMVELQRKHGRAPTLRDLGEALGITSPNGILCHLKFLKNKGWITWDKALSRSWRLTPEAEGYFFGVGVKGRSVLLETAVAVWELTREEARELVSELNRAISKVTV